MPELIDLPDISFSLLEAIFQLASKKLDPISYKEVFEWIDRYQLKPTYHKFQESVQKVDKFAFVIHPLQVEDLFIHSTLQPLKKSGTILKNAVENLVTYLPGTKYGKITGVVSEATGKEIEGDHLLYYGYSQKTHEGQARIYLRQAGQGSGQGPG
tara:strand:- start:1635 stop:2099 length:465 start_codon:yes stop_codon:yes gene_type:complete